jgi:phosphatidylglycerol lysyltransferase
LLDEPLSSGWRFAIAAALALTLWLGLFVHRHEAYSTQLWWRFALAGDAPRFLRAAVGMSIVVALFALARLVGHRGARKAARAGTPAATPAADRPTTPR